MEKSTHKLAQLESELRTAMAAKKCWRCGCFQDTVNTLLGSSVIGETLGSLLHEAHNLFELKSYDCLGCDVCWPAVAQNLAAEFDPNVAEGSHCATQAPEIREGWPPLPGNYQVIRFQAPVAVCTLNSDHLIKELTVSHLDGLSIVGSLHTENLGIEHLISNILANPYIRFLIVCGEDTKKTIGHLPGQSLLALIKNGINDKMRIVDAKGKRPLLKNIAFEHVEAFRQQVQVVDQIGNNDLSTLLELISTTVRNDPGPFSDVPTDVTPIPVEVVEETGKLVLDPNGYFIVYPDRIDHYLILEHYTNKHVLDRIFKSDSAAALYTRAIDAKLISRLDHAAYLGRELARAEQALQNGEDYVQDRAPGEMEQLTAMNNQQTASSCSCQTDKGGSCS